MRKQLLLVIMLAVVLFPVVSSAAAPGPIVTKPEQVVNIINYAVRWIYTAFFVITVIYILLAAYKFLRGGDNPKNIEDAKKSLTYAVIAIIIALFATGISVLIENFLKTGATG